MRRELGIATLVLLFGANARVPQKPATKPVDLDEPTRIGAFECAPGRGSRAPRVYADGALAQCELNHAADFFGNRLDSAAFVYLHPDGTPERAWLPWDTRLDGHMCRGTGFGGWNVDFHPNGRLRSCFLAEHAVIGGVPCTKGTFWGELTGNVYVAFHDNGRLESCTTHRDAIVGGYLFGARSAVHIAYDGRVLDPRTQHRE